MLIFILIIILWFRKISPAKISYVVHDGPKIIQKYIHYMYPKKLIIKIAGGHISLNQKLPYCLFISKERQTGIIFDKSVTISDSLYNQYSYLCKPLAVVTEKFIVYKVSGKKIDKYKIIQVPPKLNYTITQSRLEKDFLSLKPKLIKIVNSFYISFPLLLSIFIFLITLIQALWYSLVLKLIVRLFKLELPFTKAYSISILTTVIILLIKWVGIYVLLNYFLHAHLRMNIPLLNTISVSLVGIFYAQHQKQDSNTFNKTQHQKGR